MGWTMPDERDRFTFDEFVSNLELADISLGGPVFDLEKLSWLNGTYIRELDDRELFRRLREVPLADDYLLRVLPLVQERIDTLADFIAYAGFFFVGEVEVEPSSLAKLVAKGRTAPQTAKAFRLLLEEHLDGILEWSADTIEAALRGFCEDHDWSPKELFMPVRIAVTGRAATPPLFETMEVLGKQRCRWRLRRAIDTLRSMKS
jgi:glutamyl-tRNA synthetase